MEGMSKVEANMCGISLVLSSSIAPQAVKNDTSGFQSVKALKADLTSSLSARGPDAHNSASFCFDEPDHQDPLVSCDQSRRSDSSKSLEVWMFGAVLHIQGESIATQPYTDSHGNYLLWNGEVFGQDSAKICSFPTLHMIVGESDTAAVARMLAEAADTVASSMHTNEWCRNISTSIAQSLATVHGPYAFIYHHKQSNTIHFGRDPFGRRSLVLGHVDSLLESLHSGAGSVDFAMGDENVFALSSACPPTSIIDTATSDLKWAEVSISGVYSLHLASTASTDTDTSAGFVLNLSCTPWPTDRLRVGRIVGTTTLDISNTNEGSTFAGSVSDLFLHTLQDAVQRRVNSMPHTTPPHVIDTTTSTTPTTTTVYTDRSRVGVLFSGGIDSVLLTALLHHATPPGLAIDLLNVTFIKTSGSSGTGNGSSTSGNSGSSGIGGIGSPSPDRVAAIAALAELQTIFPDRKWRLVHIDVGEEERYAHEPHIKGLIKPSDTHMDLNIGTAFYFASRGKGYLRDYTSTELQELFSATTDMNEEEEERGGGSGGYSGSGKGRSNKGRPLLRHGAAGAAGVGCGADATTIDATTTAPVLIELSPGKLKCHIDICNRVYKSGCVNYCCKKCCDLTHRTSVLGSDVCSESGGEANVKNRLKFIELDAQNPCPAHRVKNKQLNKMRSNINAQMSKLNMIGDVHAVGAVADHDASEEAGNATNQAGTAATTTTKTAADTTNPTSFTSPTTCTTSIPIPVPTPITTTPYQCCCKALLVGIGADEQMAGYGRHRTVYMKAYNDALAVEADTKSEQSSDHIEHCTRIATAALEQELNRDLNRLWKRNLGRDDRCISDNGKEAWFPFLDERVVALLQSLPMHQICDLSLAQGVGDKRILRGAAKSLGLQQCTELVKRAIQFGTRVAQHTNQHYHGSNRKGKGDTKL